MPSWLQERYQAIKRCVRNFAHRVKFWLFRNFWTLAVPVIPLSLLWLGQVISDPLDLDWTQRVTLVGGVFSILYFWQRQKLAETRLFSDLFQDFNQRYDAMNEDLNEIRQFSRARTLSQNERDVLYDYFNLCAEEYLYYDQGYIPEVVWRSWKQGMDHYMEHPTIRSLWEEECSEQGGAYYGLEEIPFPRN
jgi:hypothetical protein